MNKPQTVAQVLRALKPFLPPAAVKFAVDRGAGVGYHWDKRVEVRVRAVCRWNGEDSPKTCEAYSVTVGAYGGDDATRLTARLSSRDFRRRKDGTYNVASVGVQIVEMIRLAEKLTAAQLASEREERDAQARRKFLQGSVRKFFVTRKLNVECLDGWQRSPHPEGRHVRRGAPSSEGSLSR